MDTAPNKLAFVDIETTGGNFSKDRIIEIGIIKVENNKIVETFHSLINPGIRISPFISNLTNISQITLDSSPTFNQLKNDIRSLLEDTLFVAHNSQFDYGFLKSEYRRLHQSFSTKQLCTVKLSRLLNPKLAKHNLDSLIINYQLKCKNRHRALDDAMAIFEFYQKANQIYSPKKVRGCVNKLIKSSLLPAKVSDQMLSKVPETPGVYIFYSESGSPLYIGKSINLKNRVISHFRDSVNSTRENKICKEIAHIETISTAGELSALITESTLIKEKFPIYNRQLRISKNMMIVRLEENTDSYLIPIKETFSETSENLYEKWSVIRTQKQYREFFTQLAQKYSLCHKLLGLEKTNGACFNYHLHICPGACTGKEKPLSYNLRMIQAFKEISLDRWPYNGPILFEEQHPLQALKQGYIIDKWCLICKLEFDGDNIKKSEMRIKFDYDIYKIIKRALSKPMRFASIKPVKNSDFEYF